MEDVPATRVTNSPTALTPQRDQVACSRAHGEGGTNARPLPAMLLAWCPLLRGTLRGFAKFRLGCSLVVNDCPAHVSYGRKWAIPAKPQLSRERELVRDANGKIQNIAILEWTDRAAADAFSAAAVAAIEQQFPDAFNAPEAA